jgi:hypothetical protein
MFFPCGLDLVTSKRMENTCSETSNRRRLFAERLSCTKLQTTKQTRQGHTVRVYCPVDAALSLMCTLNGGFSHSPHILCTCHCSMPSSSFRSKFHSSRATMRRISKNAKLRPMQSRRP